MRSRPSVKLYFARKSACGGERFEVELVLESKSDTPTDFTALRLIGTERVLIGEGKSAYLSTYDVVRLEAREPERMLTQGVHRKRYVFDLPPNAPPSITGPRCVVHYAFSVHVSVPWWPDRRAAFVLPVDVLPQSAAEGTPRIVSSTNGPAPGKVYLEASIDRDVLERGGTVSGAVSVANTTAQHIRRVVVAVVATEQVTRPASSTYEAQRYSISLVEGAPPETDQVPFSLRLPPDLAPSMEAASFRWRWHIEVRAVIAFADDVVVRVPITIVRTPDGTKPRAPGRYFPVGRDRFARVWQEVAVRMGMSLDADAATLRATSGQAALALRRVYDGNTYRLWLDFTWPSLGADMHVNERVWGTDLLGSQYKSQHSTANARFVMRAREHAQLAAILGPDMLEALVGFSHVSLDDVGGHMSVGIAGTNTGSLEGWCRIALSLLQRWDWMSRNVPAPKLMESAAPGWRAFADTTGGKLEQGSMSLRDGSIGVDRFSVETHWQNAFEVVATEVTFPIDPPLDHAMTIAEPALSAAGREAWTTLAKDKVAFTVTTHGVTWRIAGPIADPQTLMRDLELGGQLMRALRGRPQSGPFR